MPCGHPPFYTIEKDLQSLFTYVEHCQTQIQQRKHEIKTSVCFVQQGAAGTWKHEAVKSETAFGNKTTPHHSLSQKKKNLLCTSEDDFKTWGHQKSMLFHVWSKNGHWVNLLRWYMGLRSQKKPHNFVEDLILLQLWSDRFWINLQPTS